MAAHPRAARTGPGASAAHSPIAARDLALAGTAATATASTTPSMCRRARTWRAFGGFVDTPRNASVVIAFDDNGRELGWSHRLVF